MEKLINNTISTDTISTDTISADTISTDTISDMLPNKNLGSVSYKHRDGYVHTGFIDNNTIHIHTYKDPKVGTAVFDNVIYWINKIDSIVHNTKEDHIHLSMKNSEDWMENIIDFRILNEKINKMYNINFD